MNNEKYAVYERNPAHGSTKNGMILGPFNSKEEAQSNGEKYGYTGDNYYVNSMNNEKMNQIIDEAYENYMNNWPGKIPRIGPCLKEEFINKCKTDQEFSEKWGLKIEERELSDDERAKIYWDKRGIKDPLLPALREDIEKDNIPTRLITITYNDETVEIYE